MLGLAKATLYQTTTKPARVKGQNCSANHLHKIVYKILLAIVYLIGENLMSFLIERFEQDLVVSPIIIIIMTKTYTAAWNNSLNMLYC